MDGRGMGGGIQGAPILSCAGAFPSMADVLRVELQPTLRTAASPDDTDHCKSSFTNTTTEDPPTQHPGPELLWGPVPITEAQLAGSPAPACSVLLRMPIESSLLARVRALIPSDVIPKAGETARDLADRLGQSIWLDDTRSKWKGKGPRYVCLNKTTNSAARRVTWSVLAGNSFTDLEDDFLHVLFTYALTGQDIAHMRCRPMPRPIFDLAVELWRHAWPFLGAYSRQHPPFVCQLLLYYELFHSAMGRHRDYFNVNHAADAMVHGKSMFEVLASSQNAPCGAKSQVPLSDVLIWTDGDAVMDLSLSFPNDLSEGAVLSRNDYTIHPRFKIPCGPGTLFIFSHLDDLHFCHQSEFQPSVNHTGHRLAFVFRWVTGAHPYHAAGETRNARKLTPAEMEVRHEKSIKLKQVAQKRRSSG